MGTRRRKPSSSAAAAELPDGDITFGADGGENFLKSQADEDRRDALADKLDAGLKSANASAGEIRKLLAYALATKDPAEKRHALTRVADLGNALRDDAREVVRNTAKAAAAAGVA